MNVLVIFGGMCFIPAIFAFFELIYREIKHYGDCNTIANDYSLILISLFVLGLILIGLGI